MLTSGDFLTLKGVRDQLPAGLINAYDQFQGKVNEYMMPVKFNKLPEDVSGKGGDGDGMESVNNDDDEKMYAERTVKDLTKLCMRVNAPMELVRRAVKMAGFTNSMG